MIEVCAAKAPEPLIPSDSDLTIEFQALAFAGSTRYRQFIRQAESVALYYSFSTAESAVRPLA